MFYCDGCAAPRKWPQTIFKSEGPCEVCGRIAVCSDMPSRDLPLPHIGGEARSGNRVRDGSGCPEHGDHCPA